MPSLATQRNELQQRKKHLLGGGDNKAKDKPKQKTSASEEAAILKLLDALVEDAHSVRGRDASVIIAEANEIEKAMAEGPELSAKGRERAKKALDEIKATEAFERNGGKLIKYIMLICTFLPMLMSGLESVHEWALRPAMVVSSADLSGKHAVVTGGCGAMGFELAVMLAENGAGVVLGCHDAETSQEARDAATSRIEKLGLRRTEADSAFDDEEIEDDEGGSSRGWIDIWPLSLESFASVRQFASRAAALRSVDLIIHNAASKAACTRTVDHHEHAWQVNYLSPYLLDRLLMPSLGHAGRVVHVTCDAALAMPDYLPWPLTRTKPSSLPRVNFDSLNRRDESEKTPGHVAGGCSAPLEYSSAKLALTLHSAELSRRLLANRTGALAHAVNPGAMNTGFHHNEPAPASSASRSTIGMMSGLRGMIMSYFPPVWIARKVYGLLFTTLANGMLRDAKTGAQATFHVATSPALGQAQVGGGLYSDQAGAFTDCGLSPSQCGRMSGHGVTKWMGDTSNNKQLWSNTERAIGAYALRPLAAGEAAEEQLLGGDEEW